MEKVNSTEEINQKLSTLDSLTDLLDSRFRIPGTQTRFGLDFLIGLVPYAGDILTFVFSGMLVTTMAKHGASGMLVLKMLWNILIDTIVGIVPFFGDIFDLKFRANRRNFNLLKEHYDESRHSGSARPVILAITVIIFLLIILVVYTSWKLLYWVFS